MKNLEAEQVYDAEDMASMYSLYRSMSEDELEVHLDCIRKCVTEERPQNVDFSLQFRIKVNKENL